MHTMEEKDIHKEHRKRLRERFDKDPGGFTKHELLELLLFYAIPRRNVNPVAHKLLAKYGSVKNVLRADGKDLAEVDGIGDPPRLISTLSANFSTWLQTKNRTKPKFTVSTI